MWSQLLAVAVGAGIALVGQVLGQALTTQRERRADFGRAVDRAVGAFAEGERTLDDLTDAFDGAFDEWEVGFLECKIIVRENESLWGEELREARGHATRFRGEFYDVALERAANAVGRVKG